MRTAAALRSGEAAAAAVPEQGGAAEAGVLGRWGEGAPGEAGPPRPALRWLHSGRYLDISI